MATQNQIDANRANSQKSTGPRSLEGKSASSMNALKSGIDAQSQVIRTENSEDLEALKHEYYSHFHPTNPIQRMLVDTLIDSEWLLRRFRIVEAQLWESGARLIGRGDDDVSLGKAFDFKSSAFDRLQRRINTAHKNYYNALKELRQLPTEIPAPTIPEPEQNQPLAPEIGFVPQPLSSPTIPPAPAVTFSPSQDQDTRWEERERLGD